MKKIILAMVLALAGWMSADAENLKRTDQFSSISGIIVHDNFNVILQNGHVYSAILDLDSRVADYCRVYLQGTILVLDLDEKSIPSELKAQLRQRNAAPVSLTAVVTLPASAVLQSIELSQNAGLTCGSTINAGEKLSISTAGNSSIKDLKVNGSEVSITTQNKSTVDGRISASNTVISADQSSKLNLNVTGANLTAKTASSAQFTLDASLSDVKIEATGSSQVTINGAAKTMLLSGRNFSSFDAHSSSSEDVTVQLKGNTCTVAAKNKLKMEVSGGASLVYVGTPDIEIIKIENSSVQPLVEQKSAEAGSTAK